MPRTRIDPDDRLIASFARSRRRKLESAFLVGGNLALAVASGVLVIAVAGSGLSLGDTNRNLLFVLIGVGVMGCGFVFDGVHVLTNKGEPPDDKSFEL